MQQLGNKIYQGYGQELDTLIKLLLENLIHLYTIREP